VVQGTAKVRRGDEEFTLDHDQSTFIPKDTIHGLTNEGAAPLVLIEVRTGDILSEDDITRLDDAYGRS